VLEGDHLLRRGDSMALSIAPEKALLFDTDGNGLPAPA